MDLNHWRSADVRLARTFVFPSSGVVLRGRPQPLSPQPLGPQAKNPSSIKEGREPQEMKGNSASDSRQRNFKRFLLNQTRELKVLVGLRETS